MARNEQGYYFCEDCNTKYSNISEAERCESLPHQDILTPQGRIFFRLQKINGGTITQITKFVSHNKAEESVFNRMREELILKDVIEKDGKVLATRGRGKAETDYYRVNKKKIDEFLWTDDRSDSQFLWTAVDEKWSHPKALFRIKSALKKNPKILD